ncbi:hypothetical protein I551_4958 [Mycobacterium ulcerans str. Harvey]|uniref:Uncharacterized protein n=1 Tax=Mycobacterium ulcerans str. Harvey TaxID=1299332 RepID=A0ABN0QV75_MYCUL|nr:hypothetical protein I551_4958 [Mycobacterium ulcerans str. Harvey]
MGLLFRLVELLVLIASIVGLIYAGIRAISSLNRRSGDGAVDHAPQDRAAGQPDDALPGSKPAQWRAIRRAIDAHDETNTRWLDYELDVAKLLDFPVMTDMRDPITTRFHKAKLAADFHRPMRAEDLLDDRDAAKEYFDAVQNYVIAFNAAEAEAMRRRRSDFSREGQQRLARARACCGWPRIAPPPPKNARGHTTWPAMNSTVSWSCLALPEPASNAASPGR